MSATRDEPLQRSRVAPATRARAPSSPSSPAGDGCDRSAAAA